MQGRTWVCARLGGTHRSPPTKTKIILRRIDAEGDLVGDADADDVAVFERAELLEQGLERTVAWFREHLADYRPADYVL